MKKGFTLVELLAVIVIIGIVAFIAVPAVIKNISESKQELYELQVQDINLAAKQWAMDHYNELDAEYLNDTMVPVSMLQTLEYLPNEVIKDPTGKTSEMNGCVRVSYDLDNKTYKYSYIESLNDCKVGYYYEYNEDTGLWNKNVTNQKISIATYLIGENNQNIVANGTGLYVEDNHYVFRGAGITNNYVKIGTQFFRIVSIDKTTKSLKLVSTDKTSSTWNFNNDVNFASATIHTDVLSKKTAYDAIVNSNMKWNVGRIEIAENLNLDAIKTYEKSAQISMNVGILSMSEYMEASLNSECSNGNLSSCKEDNYLPIRDAWTLTTTDSLVAYIDASGNLLWESDLVSAYHNLYETIYVKSFAKNPEADGTIEHPFIISVK